MTLWLLLRRLAMGASAEWGEFLHRKGEVFSDFDRIREEIVRDTERVIGKNKGVTDKPVNLKIYSPHVRCVFDSLV